MANTIGLGRFKKRSGLVKVTAGPPNRKQDKKLQSRLEDWSRTMQGSKAPSPEAFHRPGSNK